MLPSGPVPTAQPQYDFVYLLVAVIFFTLQFIQSEMTKDCTKPKIDIKYVAVFAIAVFLSWVLHELAHWIVGEYLGYKMGMTLNKSYPISGQLSKDLHYQIISAAGPIFTLCEALLVFLLMTQRKRILLYPFIFTCFYMRLFATIISFRHSNDEARISTAIGIGKFTLPIIMTGILFVLLFKVSKTYSFNTKFNLANLGLTILFSSLIILTDMYFKVRLL
jgi:hypothetical protein